MDLLLREWLLDNRPYTKLNTRLRQFMMFLKLQEPRLSWTQMRKHIYPIVQELFMGEVGRTWMRDRCFERVLRLYGMNDQRTAQWHAKRGEMITASEVYKIFGTPEARREVMLRKLEPPAPGDGSQAPALLWGTRFEPVAKRIYEETTQCTILDVSCVQHPRYPFLGASPDGLIVPNDPHDTARYGRLVEFKCPISRVAKDEIPPGYVHQMQMQMECTGIDECEYVEFRFKQLSYNEWEAATDTKGSFAVYEDGKVEYDNKTTPETAQVIYWVLMSVKKNFVPRDPNWLTDHISEFQKFWDEVLQHRAAGTLPVPPLKHVAMLDV